MNSRTKRGVKPAKPRPAFGWAGVINGGEIDVEAMLGYGVIYPTRKAGRAFYQRVIRVKVVPA